VIEIEGKVLIADKNSIERCGAVAGGDPENPAKIFVDRIFKKRY